MDLSKNDAIIFLFLTFALISVCECQCLSNEYACLDQSSGVKCIPEDFVCDSFKDCTDNSDELNCASFSCNDGFLKCSNGQQCYVEAYRCDGFQHCNDASDESDCGAYTCLDYYYKCADGMMCVSDNATCDGYYDCNDGSDEDDCYDTYPTETTTEVTTTVTTEPPASLGKWSKWSHKGKCSPCGTPEGFTTKTRTCKPKGSVCGPDHLEKETEKTSCNVPCTYRRLGKCTYRNNGRVRKGSCKAYCRKGYALDLQVNLCVEI